MATVTESDLKEIKDLIVAGFSRIDNEIAGLKSDVGNIKTDLSGLKTEVTELKITVVKMQEKLSGEIKILDEKLSGQINVVEEKVNGLGKRLDFQEFINRGVIVGAGLGLITALANLLGFLPRS